MRGEPKTCWARIVTLGLLGLALQGCGSKTPSEPTPQPTPLLRRLSTDSYSNSSSQHATQVEPSLAASGSTLLSVFQVGRNFSGGAANLGYVLSSDGGSTWTSNLFNGITVYAGGTYSAASDPVVVFDRAHSVWLVAYLPISASDFIAVSRSSDAMNWSPPLVISATRDADKPWIACDNTASSQYFGHCYVEWDDPSANGLIWMTTSADGGATWSTAANTTDLATGVGGQPLVQPSGNVVVPIQDGQGTHMIAYTSADGGKTWGTAVQIAGITDHEVAGNFRTDPLPAAVVDAAGTVSVVWQDCRFRAGCASNDIVLSTSTDGINWTAPARIPIDATSSTADYFLPTLAVDPATSGASAHMTLLYHAYSNANCAEATCALSIGYLSSGDGGVSWSAPSSLAGPMTIDWLPNTVSGRMLGDYVGLAYSGAQAIAVFAVAQANTGTVFNEAMYTPTAPLAAKAAVRAVSYAEKPVPHAHSDHGPKKFYDEEHRYPVKPPRIRRRH